MLLSQRLNTSPFNLMDIIPNFLFFHKHFCKIYQFCFLLLSIFENFFFTFFCCWYICHSFDPLACVCIKKKKKSMYSRVRSCILIIIKTNLKADDFLTFSFLFYFFLLLLYPLIVSNLSFFYLKNKPC